MKQYNSSKLELSWKIYRYIKHKPELVKNEKIANLLLRATKYLCETIRNNLEYKTFHEIIAYLNTTADKENALKIEPVVFNEELYSEF